MMGREVLLKKLLHRSMNMGSREMDILMGGFATENLESFSDRELLDYEKILEINDTILYGWISGKDAIPETHFSLILWRIKNSISLKST
jgi:antitoxin CptB